MRRGLRRARAAAALVLAACAEAEAGAKGCRIVQRPATLPARLAESSGVAASRAHPGVLWSHNDSGGKPTLVAVTAEGRLLGAVAVAGAENHDWEDVAVAPCGAGSCVWIADTGDNDGDRRDVELYRLPEPAPGATTARAERFALRYPGGSRDAEALFVLPGGQPYLVTKGRNSPIAVYRVPLPLRAGGTAQLQRVVELGPMTRLPDLVTGASASPSGRWVAIRTYKSLAIYPTDRLLAGDTRAAQVVDLTPVGEAQGEAVALLDDGRVVLTSEGGFKDSPGTIAVMQCELKARSE